MHTDIHKSIFMCKVEYPLQLHYTISYHVPTTWLKSFLPRMLALCVIS